MCATFPSAVGMDVGVPLTRCEGGTDSTDTGAFQRYHRFYFGVSEKKGTKPNREEWHWLRGNQVSEKKTGFTWQRLNTRVSLRISDKLKPAGLQKKEFPGITQYILQCLTKKVVLPCLKSPDKLLLEQIIYRFVVWRWNQCKQACSADSEIIWYNLVCIPRLIISASTLL